MGDQLPLGFDGGGDDAVRATRRSRSRSRWGWLLRHVFRADVEKCRRCGGPMRWVEAATMKDAIGRLLVKHGLGPQPPPAPVFTPNEGATRFERCQSSKVQVNFPWR